MRLASIALALLTLSSLVHAQTAPATRPAIAYPRHDLHLPDMPLHDPWILAHAPTHTYYLYTGNQPRMTGIRRAGTMVYKSKDLRTWEGPTNVFQVPDNVWAKPNEGAWAPEVHEYKGRYYLFTTLHNSDKKFDVQDFPQYSAHARGTVIAGSDSPDGPFTLLKTDGPVPPADFMTLDGTLYVDPAGKPWMVYAHEWIQKFDGTFEAVPLKDDLSAASGPPIHLFKASDAPWLNQEIKPERMRLHYVTDGCELFRTKTGKLLMLWSSYENGSYVETQARSKSDGLEGPWEQLEPLVKKDSGHGMLFRTFEGQLMLVLHRPFNNARGKLYEMSDEGDHLKVIRQRKDLDGDE